MCIVSRHGCTVGVIDAAKMQNWLKPGGGGRGGGGGGGG